MSKKQNSEKSIQRFKYIILYQIRANIQMTTKSYSSSLVLLKDKFEWIDLDPMTFFETWSTVPNLNEWFIEYEQRNKNIADQKKHLEFLKRENNFLVNCKLYDDV